MDIYKTDKDGLGPQPKTQTSNRKNSVDRGLQVETVYLSDTMVYTNLGRALLK